MKKKSGMHRFTDHVVAAKGKREVADPSADTGMRQVLFDPGNGFDEIYSIGIVLLYPCCNGKDVRVEIDIICRGAYLFGQDVIGTLSNADPALESGSLPLFIKRHDHCSSSHFFQEGGMFNECLLTLLQTD